MQFVNANPNVGQYDPDWIDALANDDNAEVRLWLGSISDLRELASFDWNGRTLRIYTIHGDTVTAYPQQVPDVVALAFEAEALAAEERDDALLAAAEAIAAAEAATGEAEQPSE